MVRGQRLGQYEILEKLGEGGMGEVYRARDTKLDRAVAIKVLPESLATDPERLARFEREAKTLAALNHPNIAIVHGFEEADSIQALVMELVEGVTLAERIAQGRLSLEEALPIARQIADALEAAHDQGIIHRDLKPANIKLRPDGTVKVLDFGLAKALSTDATGTSASLSLSPTITSPALLTGAGMILGTAAYMSPEQARGKAVDRRSDLWAFGCVVYEMLTGRPAFDGAEVTDVLARVIEREPDVAALPANTPPSIRRLLRRCLEKDRRKRLADAADARLEIDETLKGPGAELAAVVSVAAPMSVRRQVFAGAAAIVLAAAAGYAGWTLKPAESRPTTRLTIGLPDGVDFVGVNSIAVSPDGRRVAYAADGRLFLRSLDRLDPAVIAGDDAPPLAAARSPVFSPDGEWIAFWEAGQLKKVSVSGGAPVSVCALTAPTGLHWADDDSILIGRWDQGIGRVAASGGRLESIITVDEGQRAAEPQLLPDGRSVLFSLARTASWDEADIVVQSLDTGARKTIVAGGTAGHYLPTGHVIYALRGVILALPFDLASLSTSGGPTPVLEGVWQPGGTNPYAQVAVSADGTLVYGPPPPPTASARIPVWVDHQGREEAIAVRPRSYAHPRLSPDGTRLALHYADDTQNVDVWVWDFARRTWTRVTSDPGVDGEAIWTPDGQSLLFASRRTGTIALFRQAATGAGSAEQLSALMRQSNIAPTLSPDGRYLVVRTASEGSSYLTLLDLGDALRGSAPLPDKALAQPLLQTEFEEYNAQISPDGRWLAYTSNESGGFEVHVRPFPDVTRGQWQVSRAGGSEALWSRDGRALFYRALDGAVMRVEVTPGTIWTAASPTQLIAGGAYVLGPIGNAAVARTYDVAPDGKRLLMLKAVEAPGQIRRVPHLVVVQNWFEELKAQVPTK